MSAPEARPPLGALLRAAAAVALGAGLAEVAVRHEPRLGLSFEHLATWAGLSVALSWAWLTGAALVGWLLKFRPHGLMWGALLAAHAAVFYRFEFVLNAFAREPRVWAGVLGIGLVSVLLGLLADPWLRRGRWPLGLGVGLSLASLLALAVTPSAGEGALRDLRPNVVLVTLDTTRPDRLGAYGHSLSTPALSRLAREGVRFEDAVSTAPLTEPAHLAMLTGIPPFRSGVVSNGTPLGERPAMLPHRLRAAGYTTAAFVSAFPLHGSYGWDQAFDVYDDDFGAIGGLHRLSLVKAWDQIVLPQRVLRERKPGGSAVTRGLAWLDDHRDEQSFLWVHLFDPHAPYEAPGHAFDPPTDGPALELPGYWPPPHRAVTSTAWLESAYEAELSYVDAQVGRLVDEIEAMGLLDDTVIVVTADHGESLTEHDYLFDHGDYLYDASLRVPLIVRYPPVAKAGHVADCQVSTLDLPQTLLALLSLDDDQVRFGRDLGPALRGEDCEELPVFSTTVAGRFVEVPPVDHAVRLDGYKLIRLDPDGERTNAMAGDVCFDLAADPGELRPLDICPPRFEEILGIALSEGDGPLSPAMDAQTRAALEALGYLEFEEEHRQ